MDTLTFKARSGFLNHVTDPLQVITTCTTTLGVIHFGPQSSRTQLQCNLPFPKQSAHFLLAAF